MSKKPDPHTDQGQGMGNAESKGRILIVDDDTIILDSLCEFLQVLEYEVEGASSFDQAVGLVDRDRFDLLITDVNMPGGNGFELLHMTRKKAPETVVIMMTAYGTIESAVEAIKMGAYDYLTKPIVDDELELGVKRALTQQMLLRENRELKQRLDLRFGLENIVGHDYRMLKVFDLVESVADSKVSVLIQGESGTGKTLVAKVVHQRSSRGAKPFVEVSCGAIPDSLLESELFGHVRGAFTGAVSAKEGKFKTANGGTIFLDEIDTASPALQVKLLRVLQSQEFEPVGSTKTESVDVRVVLATNVDLEEQIEAGRFRQDLYYRINVVTLQMPSIKDRVSDIPLLAEYFLKRFRVECKRDILGFDQETLRLMQQYPWPGNVRELENAVERAVVLAKGTRIMPHDLPPKVYGEVPSVTDTTEYHPMPLKTALEVPEKRIIESALEANGWNRQLTAQQLEINRTTLYKKMKRYGLEPELAIGR